MQCPQCKSADLDIRHATDIERVMVFLTQKRKFRCRDCKRVFRAPDRRFQPRELNDVYDAAFTVEILR
ncbi:MAG TPA: hypothetical protein VHY84_18490 [Bryobacteraceae bacterium]|nr:hypothetical protein [Bryobacteraceae bacterium]